MFSESFYVICQNIRSLHNVGSIFRTADAAAITKLYLCGYTSRPPRDEISKVALGAELSVPWESHAQVWRLIEKLRSAGVQIVALENNIESVSIYEFKPKFPLALIIGNEVGGLSSAILQRADAVVHLPMHGKKESLNVSVAFGIAVYELNKFRK
ncbi:RNA methyltransferase [Candidatus Acetothermia bacterium]|nr:RNA methyltransferase [Candidatus Acetothermia bacterium]MBI3661217.1 RNA methyltransferase [Candidatus Acetothermia bacterium]